MNTLWCLLIYSLTVGFISSLRNEETWHVLVNFSFVFFALKEIYICLLYMVGKQLCGNCLSCGLLFPSGEETKGLFCPLFVMWTNVPSIVWFHKEISSRLYLSLALLSSKCNRELRWLKMLTLKSKWPAGGTVLQYKRPISAWLASLCPSLWWF